MNSWWNTKTCDTCDGEGYIECPMKCHRSCDRCGDDGVIVCGLCGGTGVVRTNKSDDKRDSIR